MKYPIKSKEGFPILTTDNAAIPLHGIKDLFASSSREEQIRLCKILGIEFANDGLTLALKERGKAYKMPDEDRNIVDEDDSEYEFHLAFRTVINDDKFPLKISLNLNECSGQTFVNFLGEVRFQNWKNFEVVVPLVGRGTAALEGKVNDAHAGLCTSGPCASFQERVAILSSILACFEITRDDIEIFRNNMLKICNKYLGIEELVSYTIDKAFSLTNVPYFEYMKNIYIDKEEDETPLMLTHFIDFGEPHPVYFYELTLHLTSEEIDNELKDISPTTLGPDQKPISTRVREIINKFILSDEIYLVQPYPGNLVINSTNESITIYEIANEFNANSLDRSLGILEKMGVIVNDDVVIVSFVESGRKYMPNKDKIDISDKISDEVFRLNLRRKSQNTEALLKLKIFLDIKPINNVNFFGKIEVKHSFLKKLVIPLVGRGTIALEGSIQDKHKGFCTGGDCASFLQRVAIIYCSLLLLDVDSNDLNIFETNIKSINNRYHGRHHVVDYIFKVDKEEDETYFEYMKKTNMDYSVMPIVLKTILTYNRLPSKYYEELISKYTEEELLKEEQLFDKSRSLNFFFGAIRQARLFIKSIDIF